ncbi:MAG: tetratricopeptide repeat protein [Oligoflexales bacterium]
MRILIFIIFSGCQSDPGLFYHETGDSYIVYSGGDLRSTLTYIQNQHIKDQVKTHLQKIKKNPWSINDYNQLAYLYLSSGQINQAHKIVEKALKIDFRSRRSRILKAAVAYRKNRDMEAKMLLELLGGERAPEAEVSFYLSSIALRKGDTEESRRLLQIAIRKNPKFVAAYMNLGLFYLKNYQADLARSNFKKVLRLIPNHDDARLHLAILDAMSKRYQKARDVYDDLHSKYPNNGMIILNRGVLSLKQNQISDAYDDLLYYLDSIPEYQKSRHSAQTLWSGIQSMNKRKKSISYTEEIKINEKINNLRSSFRNVDLDVVETVSGFVFTPKGAKPIGI